MPVDIEAVIRLAVEELLQARDAAGAVNLLDLAFKNLNSTISVSDRILADVVSRQTLLFRNIEQGTVAVNARTAALRAQNEVERRVYQDRIEGIRRSIAEEERAARERFTFEQRVAPSSSIAGHHALIDAQINDLRRYYTEQERLEERAARERFTFQQQLAPRMNVAVEQERLARLRTPMSVAEAMAGGGGMAGIAAVGAASTVASREVGHLTAIFDELMRGNMRQVVSSVGSALRDAGLGAAALTSGVGALATVFGVLAIERMATRFGDLALKERSAAASAAMGIEDYSKLRATFELASGTSADFGRTLDQLATHAEQALNQPFSRSAGAFATLQIGMNQLSELMKNPIQLLDVLRQRWQTMGDSMLRTETFRALLGRGFEQLVPYLNLTDSDLRRLTDTVQRAGNYLTTELAERLVVARERAGELSAAFTGLGQRVAVLGSDTGLIDILTREVETLGHATDGWIAYFRARNQHANIPDPIGEWAERQNKAIETFMNKYTFGAYGALLHAMGPAAPVATAAIPPDVVSGGLRAGGALSRDQALNLIEHYESGGRNIPNYRYDRTHTAGGYFQITNTTWRNTPGHGNYANAMAAPYSVQRDVAGELLDLQGLAPWANYNPALAAAVRGLTIPGVSLPSQTTSAKPDVSQQKREFDQSIKQIEDITKLREAADKKAIEDAHKNQDEINKIAAARAAFDGQQAQKEADVRQRFAAQLAARGYGPNTSEYKAALDSTNSQVKAINAQTEASRAVNALQDEGIKKQIATAEAAKAVSRNTQDKLALDQKIAALQAQLDPSRGALVIAQGQAKVTQEQVTSLERAYTAQQRQGNLAERTLALNLAQQRGVTEPVRAAAELQLLNDQAGKLNAILEVRKQLAIQQKDDVELEKIKSEQAELQLSTLEKQAVIQKQIRDDAKKTLDAWAAPFKSAVDQVGSSIEKAVTDLVLMRGTTQDITRNLYQSFVKSAIDLGGSVLSKAAAGPTASLLGYTGQTAGKGVGDVLSSAIGDKIGGLFSNLFNPSTAAQTTAAVTLNTAGVSLNTAAAALTAAAATLGAGGAASSAGGLIDSAASVGGAATRGAGSGLFSGLGALFALKRGGIIPSAAGGWAIPNFAAGGIPAIVHSGEMVLPQHISQWVQSAAARGGAGGAVHVHLGTGGTFLDGAGFQRWFKDNGGHAMVADSVRAAWRSNDLTLRNG